MFASSNPFPNSPIHGLPPPHPPIFSGEDKDVVNNYFNHHPFSPGEYCSFVVQPPPPPDKQFARLETEDNNNNDDNNNNHHTHHLNKLSDSVISPSRKRVAAASKKDRHSKIFTAQGPRDRRVRLSIDISKKFFGLQDLLGFDKASKTLDWLFTRSKTAIKDLVEEMKHNSSSSSLLSDQCEQVFMEKGDYVQKNGRRKKPAVVKCVNNGGKRKKKTAQTTQTTQKQKSRVLLVNLAVRSKLRAEARSRARERTMEKLRVKKLNNNEENVVGDSNYCYFPTSCENQVQLQTNHEDKIGEFLTQEKLPKPYSLVYNSHQKYYLDSKDSNSRFKNRTAR